MVVRSLAPTLEARDICTATLFLCKGEPRPKKPKERKKTKSKHNSQKTKKRLGEERRFSSLYLEISTPQVTIIALLVDKKETPPAHTRRRRRRRVPQLPTQQTRKKEELLNKRIVAVVLTCRKTFSIVSFVPKKYNLPSQKNKRARER